jgi:hypothetical protein
MSQLMTGCSVSVHVLDCSLLRHSWQLKVGPTSTAMGGPVLSSQPDNPFCSVTGGAPRHCSSRTSDLCCGAVQAVMCVPWRGAIVPGSTVCSVSSTRQCSSNWNAASAHLTVGGAARYQRTCAALGMHEDITGGRGCLQIPPDGDSGSRGAQASAVSN